MNVISFSLWGEQQKYTTGAIKNAQLAKILYPGWTCRYYCAESVPKETIKKLIRYSHVEIVPIPGDGDWSYAANRFLCFNENIDFILTRDTDSRLSIREATAVQEWIKSGTKAHIMRDHPFHSTPVLAGMFGIKGNIINNMHDLLNKPKNYYHYDQDLLTKHVIPLIQDDCTIHDEFFDKKPFPTPRIGSGFVGESFDHNDIPNARHRRAMLLLI